MPARIELDKICAALYNQKWTKDKDDRTTISRKEFEVAIIRSGLMVDKSAIRTKWLALPGFGTYTDGTPCLFTPIPSREDIYIVDLLLLRARLGITTPKAGDYIVEASQ